MTCRCQEDLGAEGALTGVRGREAVLQALVGWRGTESQGRAEQPHRMAGVSWRGRVRRPWLLAQGLSGGKGDEGRDPEAVLSPCSLL